MSLIHDALRRLESNPKASSSPVSTQSVPQNVAVTSPSGRPIRRRAARQWLTFAAAILGFGTLAIFVSRGAVHKPAEPTAGMFPSTAAPAVPPELLPPPPPLLPPAPVLQLQGIVQGIGEPFAIINGTTVHLGDTIDGAMLYDIQPRTVRLRRDNEEIVLRTTR